MRKISQVFTCSTIIPPPTDPNSNGDRNSCLGEVFRDTSDDERTMFETHYFWKIENSVTKNGKNVVVSEETGNSDSKVNEISPLIPSEEEALCQPLIDNLLDT